MVEVLKQLKRLTILSLVTFVLLMVTVGVFAKLNYDLAVKGDQAHTAVCTLRSDLGQRIKDGEEFLRTHPDGIAGVTAKEIQVGINNQKSTYKSLSSAGCP